MIIDKPSSPRLESGNVGRNQIKQWFLLVVACGLAWRLVRFGLYFEITGDESGILRSVMERGYDGLLEPLSYSNVSPPLFLWMTKFLDSVFQNEWAVRLVPFLAGLGAVAVFGLICRETLHGTARWLAWAVFSVTYVPVVEGTRVKGYTIDLFIAVVMLWLTLRWLLHERKPRYLVGLALCAPLFIWFSYTAVFVIGAVGFVLTASLVKEHFLSRGTLEEPKRTGWRNLGAAAAFLAVALVSAVLLYELNVRRGLRASLDNGLADAWQRGYPPDQWWKFPSWFLTAQTGRGFAWPLGGNDFCSTATCALWLVGLVVSWRHDNRLVWALFVAPQVLLLAAALLHKYPYLQNPRLCLFLGPGICLFMGRGAQQLLDRMDPKIGLRWHGGIAFALALCAIGGMGRDIVLRIRELQGPGIRSTLTEASRMAGADGQFVALNDENTSGVFAYYVQRKVKQRVWRNGQIPTQAEAAGHRLALMAAGSKASNANGNALFDRFEKQFGRQLKIKWSQVAHEVLLDNKDSVSVWVCE